MTEATVAILTVGTWCFLVGFMLGRAKKPKVEQVMVLPVGADPDFNPTVYALGQRVAEEVDRLLFTNKCIGLPGTVSTGTTIKAKGGEVVMTLKVSDEEEF